MTDAPPSPAPRWLAWMPATSVGALIAGALLTGGGLIEQVKKNDLRVEQQARDIRDLRERMSRHEALEEIRDRETRR